MLKEVFEEHKIPLLCLLAALIIVIALYATALIPAMRSEAPDDLPLVTYVNFKVYDPVYIGIDRGFFHDRGIDVKIVGDVLAGPTAIQAVSAGTSNAGLSSIPAIINANLAGLPIIGITDIQSALENQPLEHYYSLCDAGINSIEDMVGKTAAVNLWYSSFHYTIIMELERHGLQEDDLTYMLISFPNQMPALLNGDVNMIGLMEPYNSMALGLYGDQLCEVFNANDTFATKQFSLIFVNRIWAENNPDLATAFAMGIVDSIEWIEANQDQAKQIISAYTDIPVEFVPDYYFQQDGRVVMEDVVFWFDYLKDRSDNPDQFWMGIDTIATNDYRD